MNNKVENITNIVCSFSGGRSSARMIEILETKPEYARFKKHYVFSNTGKELTETILFVKNCEYLFGIKIWLIEAEINQQGGVGTHYRIIENYSQLSMDGEPYKAMIKKYGLPSVAFPHCTRELKIVPIAKFIKHHLGLTKENCVQALGMRYDEPKRINPKPHFIYPLYDAGITKKDVLDYWTKGEKSKYDLGLEEFEGNCDFCFKKSWSKLKEMAKKYPTRLLWWNEMEETYYEKNSEIFRGHKVALDLYENKEHSDVDIACACGKSEDFFEII